jgi:hypothetical protein
MAAKLITKDTPKTLTFAIEHFTPACVLDYCAEHDLLITRTELRSDIVVVFVEPWFGPEVDFVKFPNNN